MKGFWLGEARLGTAAASPVEAEAAAGTAASSRSAAAEKPTRWRRRSRIAASLAGVSARSGAPRRRYFGGDPRKAAMRIALAQIDPTVGDIDANAAKIAAWIARAAAAGAELAIFPELSVPGYPAEDLYLKRHFLEANRRAVEELAARVSAG